MWHRLALRWERGIGRLFVCKTCHPLGFSAKLGPCGTVMCKRRQLGLAAPRAVVVRVLKNLGNTACAEPPQNRVDAGTADLPRPRATIARSTESSPRLTALTISAWSASGLISVGTREPSRCAL